MHDSSLQFSLSKWKDRSVPVWLEMENPALWHLYAKMGRPKKRTRETSMAFAGTRLPRRHIVLKQLPGKHLKIHWMEKHMWCAHKCSVWMKCHGWWWHQETVTITCKNAASDVWFFPLLWCFPTLFAGGAPREGYFALGWWIKVIVGKVEHTGSSSSWRWQEQFGFI